MLSGSTYYCYVADKPAGESLSSTTYISLQVTATAKWKDYYLTSDDHKPYLGDHIAHRAVWVIEERGQGIVTLQAPASGNWYRDIDGNDSSGNVFADLGFEPGEAAILQMRAKLMSDLRDAYRRPAA